ncbi:MAG: sigma-70 family RNA polymerase sigma factor [Bacteroidota bacterium]
MNVLEDHELIRLLQSGDPLHQEKAFRYFYRQYYGLIESLIVRNSGQKEDVSDVFHDALIVFFNQVKNSDFSINSTVKTYFYSICRNLWLMQLRKAKRNVELKDQHEQIVLDEDLFETLEMNEKKRLLLRLLNELGEECQRILDLFYFRKLKIKQIQQSLQLASEQVVKNKKGNCLKKIRKKIMENQVYQESFR